MEPEKSTEAWIRDLMDEKAPTRCTAAFELGKTRDRRAVEHLALTLKDGYESVRRYSAESLGNIGHNSAVEPLIDALKDDDQDFRAIVATALAKITNLVFATPEEWTDWFRKRDGAPA
jgi:HEAT repeat protein